MKKGVKKRKRKMQTQINKLEERKEMGEIVCRTYECKLCGHIWIPRIARKPVQCPRCKRPDWDKDRNNTSEEKK